MGSPVDGLLLIDKPEGPTSHDVVGRIRRCLGQKRVGHAGTLDPMAAGLLPLLLGRATRLLRFLPHSPKRYRGTMLLGRVTDTDDVTGRALSEYAGELPDAATVRREALGLLGRSMQIPPAYSARKTGGRRLYELARRGEPVEPRASEIEVFRLELEPTDQSRLYAFVADVSKGTYVRGLARDLGARLGCGGALASLRRTRIGPLALADAVPLPDARELAAGERLRDAVLALERIPLEAETLRLDDTASAARFAQGGFLAWGEDFSPGGFVRVLGPTGALLGIGELHEGRLRPRVVLA